MSPALRVHATGPLALVEDLGRPGLAGIGVGPSGAADRRSFAQANRMLANPEGAAAVEVTLGGLDVEMVGGPGWMCVTGAPCQVRVDDREVGSHALFRVQDGSRVSLGQPSAGLRSYLAVRGGLDVPEVLGSRSWDALAELGPEPLTEGDELPVGQVPTEQPSVDSVPPPDMSGPVVLRAVRGPRDGWVEDPDLLTTTTWTASEQSNRVGIRLTGGSVRHREKDLQLPSEGACPGAVQVPPDGEPVLFLADHPLTGGYPVVAVVLADDVDRAAQVRPGQELRLRWVDAGEDRPGS